MDFFGDIFGHSASQAAVQAFQDVNRIFGDTFSSQDWYSCKNSDDPPVRLPWEALNDEEKGFERELREAVLLISQSPQLFLQTAEPLDDKLSAETLAPAGAVLEADEGLRQLRFRLVPKYCSEEQFWHRYFAAVAKVRQRVRAEHAWGDFDMLENDAEEDTDVRTLVNEAPKQVDLPSMRQQINAVDSSVDVGISIPASYPAMSSPSIDTAPAHANRVQQPELNQTSAPCLKAEHHVKFPSHSHQFDRQQSEGKPITVAMLQSEPPCIDCSGGRGAPFREASTERVIMSVDFATSQASSYTETFLMSPRSVGSSATRATTPSPDPIVPLSPATQHQSQAISHTLNHSTDPQEPAAHLSSFPTSALQDMRQPASSITAATQMQNETAVFVDVSGDVRHARPRSQWSHEPMGKDTGSSVLRVPFKAAHLQKLADATLTCKKLQTMHQVVEQEGMNSRIVGTRPSEAAQKLLHPVASDVAPAEVGQIDLITQIAISMVDMEDTAKMAMLWNEVLQEVECQWISGHALPACPASTLARAETGHHSRMLDLLKTVDGALQSRQAHAAQVYITGSTQQGSQALNELNALLPRVVFTELFISLAKYSLAAAGSIADGAEGTELLAAGVRQVEQLAHAAFSQPTLSRSQLSMLCQVFAKLEGMFEAAVEQAEQHTMMQEAGWNVSACEQGTAVSGPQPRCTGNEEAAWSMLDYESWTLL